MTESVIQPEPFPRNSCMFDVIVLQFNSNTSSMSLSLRIVSPFEFE